jgi:hypothetical protein
LAVAADDSVHIFVPLFPDTANDDQESEDETIADSSDDENDLRPAFLRQKRDKVVKGQAQFAGQNGQILTAFPRVDPRVNEEIWRAVGKEFPWGDSGRGGREDSVMDDGDGDGDGDGGFGGDGVDDDEVYGGDEGVDELLLFGAGNGVISSAGSGLNHVVSMAWSPSGLGRNRRPILAVLTSAGYIGFYGDGPAGAQGVGGLGSVGQNEGMLKQRDMTTWITLFGVGEKLVVPGQDTDVIEKICSFAWAREIAPGQALLAYTNDEQEVAIISIQSEYTTIEDGYSQSDRAERMTWRAYEVARFSAKGPHPSGNVWDPDWTPSGSAFGLRWSPWLSPEGSRSCFLSYVAKNYVGFRKIAVKTPWLPGTLPEVTVEESDSYGVCHFLSTDSFVEFEDAIWTKKDAKTVRGLISTGFDVRPFQVSISGPQQYPFTAEPHTTKDCDTTYRRVEEGGKLSTNPIVDLFIHPPNLATPSETPTFTLIRLAATSTNGDWYQTNSFLADISSTKSRDSKPQWVVDLAQKLSLLVPADAHMRHQVGEDDDEEDAESVGSGDANKDDDEAGLSADDEEDVGNAVQQPEVHPHRFFLHGLVAAPGGKATAVLVSTHSTQTPERTGWWGLRSTVMFGYLNRPKKRPGLDQQPPAFHRLTTEGRLWHWMYGAGPDVPGITASDVPTHGSPSMPTPRDMFTDLIASQTCDFCGTALTPSAGNRGMSICQQGHYFSTCGASGLAIQAPGISHTCGACGARTLKVEDLLRRAPGLEERIREAVRGDVCGNCGGKFVD